MNTLVCVILIHQDRRPVETIARDKVVILWKKQRCSEGKI